MQEAEIYSRLAKIFRDTFDEDVALKPSTTAQDVDGWDSFAHINLILTVEREFAIKFTTSDVERMRSVGDLATFIGQHASN
ncbi:MAG TPA: acyl carrier protein [Acidobacteriaceae bacterium]|nr:acyl carrier protein [Acidobacteriaceae bacterium]